MHLLVSDIHFGKSAAAEEREKEKDLVQLIRYYLTDLESLILVGDVFEHFIEYRNLLPKGFSRFLGQLGVVSDAGIPITYFAGNNDPWHRDFFETEFGAELVMDDKVVDLSGHRTYITHGDGMGTRWSKYALLKPILRNRIPVFLYRTLIPGDLGIGLAKFAKRTFSDDRLNQQTIEELRKYASETLEAGDITNVVMGHSHYPEVVYSKAGKYVNTGSWHYNRTFGLANESGIHLLRWVDSEPTASEYWQAQATAPE